MQDPAPFADAPPPGPTPRGWSSWSFAVKALVVFAVASSLLVVLGIFAAAYGTYLLLAPGEQIPSRAVVGPDAIASFHFDGDLEDEGIAGMAEYALERIDQLSRAERAASLPADLEFLADMGGGSNEDAMDALVPREVTVVIARQGDDLEPDVTAVVNLRKYGGMIRLFFSDWVLEQLFPAEEGWRRNSHRGFATLEIDQDVFLSRVESSIFFSTTPGGLRRALDRVANGQREPKATEALQSAESHLSPDADLTFTSIDPGIIENFTLDLAPSESAPMARGMAFGLDIVSADIVRGFLRVELEDEAEIEEFSEKLETRIQTAAQNLSETGITLKADKRAEGPSIFVDFEAVGTSVLVDQLFAPEPDEG